MDITTQLWLELYTRGGNIQSFFVDNSVKNIAIYGCATLGDLFYNEMEKYGITVHLAIDREVNEFNDIKTILPSDLKNDHINNIELIVVCANDTYNIINTLTKRINCRIVTLLEILMLCYYGQVIIPYCKKANIRPYVVSYPFYRDVSNLNAEERILSSVTRFDLGNNLKHFEDIYKPVDEYDDEYISSVFTQSPVIRKGELFVHSDIKSPYVNIINGIRFTVGNPERYKHTIHFIGHCDTLGFGVDDSRTMPSCLQKMINGYSNNYPDFRVLNHGVWGFRKNDLCRGYKTLENIVTSEGDIVILLLERPTYYREYVFDFFKKLLNKNYCLYNNLQKEFSEPRDIPLIIDWVHLSYYGMNRVAEYIFELLKKEKILQKETKSLLSDNNVLVRNEEPCLTDTESFPNDFTNYLSCLEKYKNNSSNIGAIVMNCNPFTKGHRYLIEKAASLVDYLYIFVVEEDKSLFSFDDRIMLVELGTSDLQNVKVLPSGKYILSAITFPEYFVKDSSKEISVDTSTDISIFGKSIAPVINISKRFVGQEPFDAITRQYNESLKEMLPRYGIELIEFPRIKHNGEAISASRVRKLLEMNDFTEIAKIVPQTTLDYLKAKFPHSS